MYLTPRHLLVFVVPVLVAAAVLGFVAGKRHRIAAPREPGLLAHQANLVVEYPPGWRAATGAPPIPGVAVANPLLLAPSGDAGRAGLLVGQLPAGEAGPLPAGLVRLLPQPPPTEVVSFVGAQAYRYGPLQVPGYSGTVELYAIPSSTGSPTALICYAAKGADSYIRPCEQIAASITLVEHSGYDLTPSAGYAGRLSALIQALDSQRMQLRREMSQRRSPAATAVLATTLADRFTTVAAAVRELHPPAAARIAQVALVGAIEQAGTSYTALAAAVGASGSPAVPTAQAQVTQVEVAVDDALETFELLGYKRS